MSDVITASSQNTSTASEQNKSVSEIAASAIKTASTKSVSVSEEIHETPGVPENLPETIYRLRFKVGQSPVQDMNFKFEKDQRKAETAAREFCARWKYRFIWVEEFLVDILSSPVIFEDGTAQKRPQLGIK